MVTPQEEMIKDMLLPRDIPEMIRGSDADFTRIIVVGALITLILKLLYIGLLPSIWDLLALGLLTYLFVSILLPLMDLFNERVRRETLSGYFLFFVPLLAILIIL